MANDFQAIGGNANAAFTLKIHRGERMALVAMNWRNGKPPTNFVGFAIQYQAPGAPKPSTVYNRLNFEGSPNPEGYKSFPTTKAPIQKFRWVVFPHDDPQPGPYAFTVMPMFMDPAGAIAQGEAQTAAIDLGKETYPGQINVAFTRGYVASQSFVDKYQEGGSLKTLLPARVDQGTTFVPTHPKATEAYEWMGLEARKEIFALLDAAVADPAAKVSMVAYDMSESEIMDRLLALGPRLRIIIDDSDKHGLKTSGETQSETLLIASAGAANVKREHMGGLQHNKMIVVDAAVPRAVCGSTNFSWRGLYVQSNNALLLTGAQAVAPLKAAFEAYWKKDEFANGPSPDWHSLGLAGIDANITFSPHDKARARLAEIGKDVEKAQSCLLYSLAFLSITPGAVTDAVEAATNSPIFTYGISDKNTGVVVHKPNGNTAPVYFARLNKNVPTPFKVEPSSGIGPNLHHKFVVIDFNTADARVWTGSYNFSGAADLQNGENLLLIRDRKIATSYMVERLRIFDEYHFRVTQDDAAKAKKTLSLQKPPIAGEDPWWTADYTDQVKIRDRELFA
ncbi:phospholipase D-like domain-containing protein [Mesorhizobium sp. M0047]|uniref:phospholipase D-like domain-containing protein n=1 Tax=Mesorhizobium sp. M0047 TaxID=2956859 RepID=UPI00333DB464